MRANHGGLQRFEGRESLTGLHGTFGREREREGEWEREKLEVLCLFLRQSRWLSVDTGVATQTHRENVLTNTFAYHKESPRLFMHAGDNVTSHHAHM